MRALFPDHREAIDTLAKNPKITQNIMIRGHLFHARYVVNAPGKGAFTGANPFDVASRIIPNEDSIPEYGILAVIARNRKGIFVLAAKGIERDQLDYRAKQACRLALER